MHQINGRSVPQWHADAPAAKVEEEKPVKKAVKKQTAKRVAKKAENAETAAVVPAEVAETAEA